MEEDSKENVIPSISDALGETQIQDVVASRDVHDVKDAQYKQDIRNTQDTHETAPSKVTSKKNKEVEPLKSSDSTSISEEPTSKSGKRPFFSKSNPHYKRNRWVASLASIASVTLFALLIMLLSGKAPWASGEISILSVQAMAMKDGIVDENSHFEIKTENGSIEKLRNSLYLEPAIDYEIKETVSGSLYEIIPTSSLPDNIVLNIDSVKNNVLSYKWAFQTKKDLSVSRVYPANGANYVSKDSVIEFTFSYPEVEDVESYFSIKPEVDGSFEKTARTWRFTPSSPFAENTTYEITIAAGLKYGEQVMVEDFHSSFSTYANAVSSSSAKSKGMTLDGVSYFTEKEAPIVMFDYDSRASFAESTVVNIERVSNADDYIRHLKGEKVETATVGSFDFTKKEDTGDRFAVLNQNLNNGYYVLYFSNNSGQTLYTANVIIHSISAYAFESERDLVVWVAENGELKSDAQVSFKNQNYKTGENGLLEVKNFSDFSDGIDYLKIGEGDFPLIIAINNFKNDLYPSGFIYTDRLLYAPSDTIKIWGYVPLSFFKDSPNLDNFSVVFGENIKKYVTVDRDGFFSTEIQLDNYQDISGGISLKYNDASLAYRYIYVEDFTLENYIYKVNSAKNYVFAGENVNFTVEVEHVTGFPAINKDVVVEYNNHEYFATTDSAGKVDFSLPTDYSVASEQNSSMYTYASVSIKSGGADYNKYSTYYSFYVFRNNLDIQLTKQDKNGTVTFSANTIDLPENEDYYYANHSALSKKYSGPATIKIYETRHTRTVTGYSYDVYTKENKPKYHYSDSSIVIKEEKVNFENGELSYRCPTDYKNSEENAYYTYEVRVFANDLAGRPALSYKSIYHYDTYLGESIISYNYRALEVYDYQVVGNWRYNLYRFGLKDVVGLSPYSLGDDIRLSLYDYNGDMEKNQGSVLAIAYKESVISSNVFSDDALDLQFSQNMYPGAKITGAYFKHGRFYRIAPKVMDYDEDDSELNIEISTDKDSYRPGETVRAKIIATHKDGSHASGKVNLSVVNEAIFNATDDNTSILRSIYSNKNYKSYHMSTYTDFDLLSSNGGMGGGGGGRSDFGNTIFFDSMTLNNGEAEVEFKLNDSITSFRLTALAVENSNVINAGVGVKKISSYLPLSISSTMVKRIKNTDDLVLNANSIVSSGNSIEYSFTVEELNKTLTAMAAPGQYASVNFGKLGLGQYNIVISAKDSAGNEDKLTYPLEVVETTEAIAIKKTVSLTDSFEMKPTKNPIIVEIYDKVTSGYLNLLKHLSENLNSRLDTQVAYYKSLEYSNKYYGEKSSVRPPSFDEYVTNNGSLKPLLNADGDYVLTALANYYMPNYFSLKASNYGVDIEDDDETVIGKLLVLASFKEPVLLELRYAQTLDLTPDEELKLGIAFAMLGDYDSAKYIYKDISSSNLRRDLVAVLASFVGKNTVSEKINIVLSEEPSADYINFAIISFFENNEADLSVKNKVKIEKGDDYEEFEVSALEVAKRVLYMDEVDMLKIIPSSDTMMASYYYQGKISELGEDFSSDLTASLEGNTKVGQTIYLDLNISNLQGTMRNGIINVALPPNLKLGSGFESKTGLYMAHNSVDYLKLSLSDSYGSDLVRIPLYVTMSGNYELEPIVFTEKENEYHISNNIVFDAS